MSKSSAISNREACHERVRLCLTGLSHNTHNYVAAGFESAVGVGSGSCLRL